MKKILIPMAACLVLMGCGPKLQSVRDFSDASQLALAQTEPILLEYYDSCKQSKLKDVPLDYISSNPDYKKLDDATKSKLISLAIENNLKDKCSDRKKAAEGFKAVVAALKAYIKALGELASDGSIENEAYINALSAKVMNFKDSSSADIFTNKEDVTAVSNIVLTLGNFIESGYRSNQIGLFISEPYPSVVRTYDLLISFLDSNVRKEIDANMARLENEYVNRKLDELEEVQDCMENAQCKALHDLIKQEYTVKQDEQTKLIMNIDLLVATLNESKNTFTELYNRRDDLDGEKIKLIINGYYARIIPNLNELGVTF